MKKFPVFKVFVWVDDSTRENGFDLIKLDEFNNPHDALRLYGKTHVNGSIREVILEMETEDDAFDVLQKDETGNILNRVHKLPL